MHLNDNPIGPCRRSILMKALVALGVDWIQVGEENDGLLEPLLAKFTNHLDHLASRGAGIEGVLDEL